MVEATEVTFELEGGINANCLLRVMKGGMEQERAQGKHSNPVSCVLLPCLGVLWVTGTLSHAWQAHSNTPNSCFWGFPTALGTKHLQTMLAEPAQDQEEEQEDWGVHFYLVMV